MERSFLVYSRFRNRSVCLDDLFSLDIRQWRRDHVLDCRLFKYDWMRGDEAIGSIDFELCNNVSLLKYRFMMNDLVERNGRLKLITSGCQYGGKRYWFQCDQCQRKLVKLYFFNRRFQCRHCCALPYKCQNETASDRNIRRIRKVRRLLGASDNILEPIINKPLGMHWDRFAKLLLKTDDLDAIALAWLND